ncbi:MAG TPA: AAA family ATPase [Pseudonocardia sp.]
MTPTGTSKRVEPTGPLRSGEGITTTCGEFEGGPVVVRHLDLRRPREWTWHRLERDLAAATRARSPHLVGNRVLERDLDGVTLVRPFVDGLELCGWAAAGADDRQLLKAGRELFAGLSELHRHGLVHGGLKPANAVVSHGDGRLVLLDALVSRTQLASAATPWDDDTDTRYLSPEQAGLVQRTVGPTADLYAAGLVVLEALTARAGAVMERPAPGAAPTRLLALLREVGVPRGWRPLVRRLLAPLPEDRYETAEEVLADLASLRDPPLHETTVPASARPVRAPGALAEPPLVGRTAERDRLDRLLNATGEGRAGTACLSGHSGLGKSRLLDELAAQADERGLLVLRGAAFDGAARRPLGPFREVFSRIAEYLGHAPGRAAELIAELGSTLPAVVALAPALATVLGDGPPGTAAGDVGAGAITALARLMHEVCDENRPGLLLVDDCQWADELSWKLLSAIAALSDHAGAEPVHLGLVLSMRSEALPQVRSWGLTELDAIRLDPMPVTETRAMLGAAGGRLPEPILDYIVAHAAGNPLYALSTLRALVDTAVLRGSPGRWTVDPGRMRELPTPAIAGIADPWGSGGDQPKAFLAARLEQLSPSTQLAVRQAAVLGRRFTIGLLATALDSDLPATRAAVAEASARGVLRPTHDVTGEDREFSHDRVREAVLRSMDDEALRRLHGYAARALEGGRPDIAQPECHPEEPAPGARPGGTVDYELAYHLDRSGEHRRALPYALRAAEQALVHNALDVAEVNFRIASTGLEGRDEGCEVPTRFRLHEGVGTVHMLQGRYDRAAAEFERAYRTALALGSLESARVAISLGELAFKRGDVTEADSWLDRARERLGMAPLPRRPALAAAAEAVRLALTLLVSLCTRGRARGVSTPDRERELAARLYTRWGYLAWFTRCPAVNVLLTLRALRLSLASGSPRELSHGCAMSAAMLAGLTPVLSGFALRLADHSLRLRELAHDEWGIAHSQHFRGFVLHAAGRYPEAVAALDTAIDRFDVLGDRWEQAAASWQKALCLYRQGLLHEGGALARDTYWAGTRIGDRISAGTALATWVRCLPSDVSVDTLTRELSAPELDGHTETLLRAGLGWKLLSGGDLDGAVEQLRAAELGRRRVGLRNHFLAPVTSTLLQAQRLRRDRAPSWSVSHRRGAERDLRRDLRRAVLNAVLFAAERPMALREWAVLRFGTGHRGHARVLLSWAVRYSRRMRACGELAACRLLGEQAGHPSPDGEGADELCARLRLGVDQGVVQARSLPVIRSVADTARHRAVLEAARRIVAAEGTGQILEALRTATLATTPATDVTVAVLPCLEQPEDQRVPDREPSDRSRTERVVKPIAASGTGHLALVAELPLGEAASHVQSVEVLATLAGAVLERQSLRRESAQRIVAVQEAERGRIARDLHDELGHLFAGVLEGLSVLDKERGEPGDDRVQQLRELARQGIRSARSVAWTLRPEGLDDLGVVACVEQLVEDTARRFGIGIDLTARVERPLAGEVETAVFRVVQEALTNIGRHSRATEASVLLVATAERLRVVIEDNGIGFDPDETRAGALGLAGMRERARLVGGRLEVHARTGAGAMVMVEVPFDDERCDDRSDPARTDPRRTGSDHPQRRRDGRLDEPHAGECDDRCRGL